MRVLRKEKIGRNDPCPCGSGDKYKKCCLDDDQTVALLPSSINDWEKSDDEESYSTLVITATGEPFMPVRLYYDVFDQKDLVSQLKQLKGVSFESEDLFILTYDKDPFINPLQ